MKTYCNEIKSNIINEYINKINQIENSYQLFKYDNIIILELLQFIVNTYIHNLIIILRCNIMNIQYINIYKSDFTLGNIINNFNNYSILQNSNIDLLDIKDYKLIKEHKNYANSLVLLTDDRLASCSDDLTIKIFNIYNNYQCDITINIKHERGVNYICQIYNGKIIISRSYDKSIKIWTISSGIYIIIQYLRHIMNGYIK